MDWPGLYLLDFPEPIKCPEESPNRAGSGRSASFKNDACSRRWARLPAPGPGLVWWRIPRRESVISPRDMFTGLIQDVGVVERVIPGGMTDVWIRTALGAKDFELGESIAVDGACLTVVERAGESFRVQAAPG